MGSCLEQFTVDNLWQSQKGLLMCELLLKKICVNCAAFVWEGERIQTICYPLSIYQVSFDLILATVWSFLGLAKNA